MTFEGTGNRQGIIGRAGAREDEALDDIAAEIVEDGELFGGLGALGDDRHAETAAERDDAFEQPAGALRRLDLRHEDAVDLDLVEGQLGEIAERRIVRAEIIERQRDAQPLQAGENAAHAPRGMIGEQALGQFDAQQVAAAGRFRRARGRRR